MTRTYQRLPIGAIGNAPTTPPRYVPGGSPAKPLDTRPLSEADTWPSVAASQPHQPPHLPHLIRAQADINDTLTGLMRLYGEPAPDEHEHGGRVA